ncbi:LOW QUALITY PROTEIN: hypothetical protein CRUP_025264 [Coryphaenoides rupestris]|nr:LOW QUALITY PROTEIN: hypothetical protein CRUP_025264 [Coryphaenoides rupestris]
MDPLRVKDRILENISLSVKKLQSYFAACEDETPAIRNHDRVLQRLCEHLDHALLYGLQDISSGYWVLVLHFTRKEAVRQIDELQHIATNLGRTRAPLESYLRLFQENQALLQKYYFKNALVCSDDHLALFLTLVSGLEFIRFDLELDAPYLDVAPYMPEYYKPHNLLDFEERLPSSDSLSLHSFTSLTSTNLEWDDSAIAPSSEEGDLTDPASCPRSSGSDPQTVVSDSVVLRSAAAAAAVSVAIPKAAQSPAESPSHSPVFRHNPFNNNNSSSGSHHHNDSDTNTNTSADATPVHVVSRQSSSCSSPPELAKRRKPSRKRRGKGSVQSTSSDLPELENDGLLTPEPPEGRGAGAEVEVPDSSNSLTHAGAAVVRRRRRSSRRSTDDAEDGEEGEEEEEEESESFLRLPEMTDTSSMDVVGQPLRDVMDRLDGTLGAGRGRTAEEKEVNGAAAPGADSGSPSSAQPPARQPFRGEAGREPPDRRDPGEPPRCPAAAAEPYASTPLRAEPAASGGGHHDPAGPGQPEAPEGADEDPGAAAAEEEPALSSGQGLQGGADLVEEKLSPAEDWHPAEFKVDNNHLLLLMIHVFRENEEQLFKMVRMSTGHMEGDLQPLYLLLTDCYIYLLRKGAAEKPYTVEEAVSYNELDYISGGVWTSRRWLLSALRSAMVKGCREPPYPSVLTDATMEKAGAHQVLSPRRAHCEDPMDAAALSPHGGPPGSGSSSHQGGRSALPRRTTYLGKEQWKSCYLVLSNGILYQYAERNRYNPSAVHHHGVEFACDPVFLIKNHVTPCSSAGTAEAAAAPTSSEKPHTFQVILTERPAGAQVIPQGGSPTPCIPCCLVLTDSQLLTCHQDCQTSFFRSLGAAQLCDITSVRLQADQQYCVVEFAGDRAKFLPPWVLYFSGCGERDRLLRVLETAWRDIYQVSDAAMEKRCSEALALMSSGWQRADSLARGRAQREPWC